MDVRSEPMRRVSVVGSTGSGKTTLGRELAAILGVPHVELDALFWGPRWSQPSPEAFCSRVREATATERWVVDGNYGGSGARDIVWALADTVVWLDFPLGVILARLFGRTNERIRWGGELWPGTGNVETFREQYLSRKSLYLYAVTTYRRHRRQLSDLLALPQYAHLRVHRFTRPAGADAWLRAQRAGVPESR